MTQQTPTTPRREATSLVIGVATLTGFGAYYATVHRVPFLWTVLEGLATVLYRIPAIASLRLPSVLLSSLGAALIVVVIGVICTSAIEKMCGPSLSQMENAMRARTKQPRTEKIQ
jgi:hypothetical protein